MIVNLPMTIFLSCKNVGVNFMECSEIVNSVLKDSKFYKYLDISKFETKQLQQVSTKILIDNRTRNLLNEIAKTQAFSINLLFIKIFTFYLEKSNLQ